MPCHGAEALGQQPDVSTRRRRPQGLLALLAHDAAPRVCGSAQGQLRQAEHHDARLPFVASGEQRTGPGPNARLFDAQLTTDAHLNRLHQKGMDCMTRRRRSHQLLATMAHLPASAWRRGHVPNVSRAYRRPRVVDATVYRKASDGPMRPWTVAALGHAEPTRLRSNQMRRAASTLSER
jgi:hypothetical protein